MPNLGGGGVTQMTNSLNNWNNDPTSIINYVFQGNTAPSVGGGLSTADSRNTILWEDSLGEIAGSFSCATGDLNNITLLKFLTGGILGRAGPKSQGSHVFGGTNYWTNVEVYSLLCDFD